MPWLEHVEYLRQQDPVLVVFREFLGWQHRPAGWHNPRWESDRWYHIHLVERGDISVRAPGIDVQAGPGTCLFRGPGPVLDTTFHPGVRFWEIWYCLPGLSRIPAERAVQLVTDAGDLRPVFESCCAEVQLRPVALADERDHRLTGVNQAAHLALALLLQMAHDRLHGDGRAGLGAGRRAQLLRWLREHLRTRPTPADLADLVGLTHDYFSRCFRHDFGLSPQRWIVQERIRAAARDLLESDASIEAVAQSYGFDNPSHFGRQFRSVMGESPGRWRRQAES